MSGLPFVTRVALILTIAVAFASFSPSPGLAQTREKGPWWPSPHGPKDQAGSTNYITPQKILSSERLPDEGRLAAAARVGLTTHLL